MARRPTSTGVQELAITDRSADQGSLPALPGQRRRRMFVLGVLLVLAGALAAGYLYTGLSDREAVVMVTRDIPIGTQLRPSDVVTTKVAAEPGVAVIPGHQLQQVLGRVAAVDLRKGTLLAPAQVTGALSPRAGQQVVPIAVKVDQLPARGLNPGDRVLVVPTPGQEGHDPAAGSGADPLGPDTPGSVDRVSSPDADGNVRVDLVVEARVGSAIAKQASTGRLALVLTPRGPQ